MQITTKLPVKTISTSDGQQIYIKQIYLYKERKSDLCGQSYRASKNSGKSCENENESEKESESEQPIPIRSSDLNNK